MMLPQLIITTTLTFMLGIVMATSKAIVFLVMFLCSHSAAGIPLNDFYPFGIGAGDTLHSANDDESSPAISLPFPFPYYDVDYTNILVSMHALAYSFVNLE